MLVMLTLCRLPLSAQNQTSYRANLLVGNKENVGSKAVDISLEDDRMAIRTVKKPSETTYILFSEIQSAEYTFSNRPRYTAATLGTLAFGVSGLALFLMKTKKNWLTVTAEKKSVILQLESENYRMLLLAMQNKGIKVFDSGNRTEQNKNRKSAAKSVEGDKEQSENQ